MQVEIILASHLTAHVVLEVIWAAASIFGQSLWNLIVTRKAYIW